MYLFYTLARMALFLPVFTMLPAIARLLFRRDRFLFKQKDLAVEVSKKISKFGNFQHGIVRINSAYQFGGTA